MSIRDISRCGMNSYYPAGHYCSTPSIHWDGKCSRMGRATPVRRVFWTRHSLSAWSHCNPGLSRCSLITERMSLPNLILPCTPCNPPVLFSLLHSTNVMTFKFKHSIRSISLLSRSKQVQCHVEKISHLHGDEPIEYTLWMHHSLSARSHCNSGLIWCGLIADSIW